MQEMYKQVAQDFADRVNVVFESETTLEDEFRRNFSLIPFDRTDHWAGIIYDMFRQSWLNKGPEVKSEPTGYDKLAMLRELHGLLDYNLFTQVLLNLQGYTGMAYQTGPAEKEIIRLKETWPKEFKLDPFAPKAHMIKRATVVTDEQKRYNEVISTLRSLRIISQFTPQVSFRVSPRGMTPAFADSRNISMLGEGADKYLMTIHSLGAFYVTSTKETPAMAKYVPSTTNPPGVIQFEAPGIPYPFFSKSGGEVLHDVLFSRKIMYDIFGDVDVTHETCIMVPRMNSILVVADRYGVSLKKAVEKLQIRYPA